jgi:uncharacterized protein (DUF302 family)
MGALPAPTSPPASEENMAKRPSILKHLAALAAAALLAAPSWAADPKPAAGAAQAPGGMEVKVKIMKVPVKEGVSFDDAVESLKLRANSRNFKFVGHSPLSKEVEAVTGKPSPRTEIFSFCDAVTARDFIEVSLDFAAFLPCRVAIVEDAPSKKIWVVSMMMDMSWLDAGKTGKPVPEKLKARAKEIIDIMNDMIKAASTGDI